MLRAWQWRDDYRLPMIAAAAVLVLVLPLAFLAAVLPTRYSMLLVGTVALPLGVVVGLKLSLGSLLAVAIVSPPLLQFIVQGSPEGIPPAAVAPLFAVEALLLIRGAHYLHHSPHVPFIEVAFLAAIAYAAVIGALSEGGDRRVWLAELVETANLIVLLWLLRLNRLRFGDLKDFVVLGHLLAAPFFAWYVLTKFGEYRLDFFFGLSSTLIPMTVAVIVHQQLRPGMRALLAFSGLVMIVSTAAAGIRGTTLIALLASGLVILFSLRRFSVAPVLAAFAGGLVLVMIQPLIFEVATEVAPEAVERFRTAAESPTLSVRLLEAQDAFQAFIERPSGHGLGAVLVTRHELVYESTGITIAYGPTTFVHNSYAWYLAKTGIVGFVSLVVLVVSAVVVAARRLSTSQGSAALALATLLAVLVGAWGGPTLHNVFVTPWVAIALLLAYEPAELPDGADLLGTGAARTFVGSEPPAAARPGWARHAL